LSDLDGSKLPQRPQQRRSVDNPRAADDPFIEIRGSTCFTHLLTATTGWRCRSTGLVILHQTKCPMQVTGFWHPVQFSRSGPRLARVPAQWARLPASAPLDHAADRRAKSRRYHAWGATVHLAAVGVGAQCASGSGS
jgi:hypothetical protein